MNFSYRGINYNQEPLTLDMVEGNQSGKYRGQTLTYRYPRHVTHLQPKILQYRGVAYSTQSAPLNQDSISSQSSEKSQSCVCSLAQTPSRKPKVTTIAQIHLENLRQNLEYRLRVAKTKGDEYLINLLEREYQDLAEVV